MSETDPSLSAPETGFTRDKAYALFIGAGSTLAAPFFWGGQYIQGLKDAAGSFVFPEFLRHHLTNMVDPIAVMPATALMVEALPLKRSTKIYTAAFMVAAMGVGYEAVQSNQPNRTFDYTDTACYLLAAFAYGAAIRRKTDAIGPGYADSRTSLFFPDRNPV